MEKTKDPSITLERTQNLWTNFLRKYGPKARSACISTALDFDFDRVGGLASAKDELLTYACAATSPRVYGDWGTYPPSGLLLVGQRGVGKQLLARALATRTETAIVSVDVPRLALDIVQANGEVTEFIQGWSQILEELPPLTVFFDELEFSQAEELGLLRADLPIGPIMDFLLELIDRTIAAPQHLVIGATSHPDTLRRAFVMPGRFERIVEVNPIFPDDVIAALEIHASEAEERAGHSLFDAIDWRLVVGQTREATTGDWIRILHAVLRRKARGQASQQDPSPVTTGDLKEEVERFEKAQRRISAPETGNYV
jgi:SpoVK/Ycf46/Vps4 family AAA+-type ATPase